MPQETRKDLYDDPFKLIFKTPSNAVKLKEAVSFFIWDSPFL